MINTVKKNTILSSKLEYTTQVLSTLTYVDPLFKNKTHFLVHLHRCLSNITESLHRDNFVILSKTLQLIQNTAVTRKDT